MPRLQLEDLRPVAWAHHNTMLGLLQQFNTVANVDGIIYHVERAIAEFPGEALGWLYKAALCQAAGYTMAGNHAVKTMRLVLNGATHDPVTSLVTDTELQNVPQARHDIMRRLDDMANLLAAERRRVFAPDLARFDDLIHAHCTRAIDSTELLTQLTLTEGNVPAILHDFLAAVAMERRFPQAAIEADRNAVISRLVEHLDEESREALAARAIAFRVGSISMFDFFSGLLVLIEREHIDLSPFPNLDRYFQYLALSSRVDSPEFHDALWQAILCGYTKRAAAQEEKDLVHTCTRLHFLRRLLEHLGGELGVAATRGSIAPHPRAMRQIADALSAPPPEPRGPGRLLRAIWSKLKRVLRR